MTQTRWRTHPPAVNADSWTVSIDPASIAQCSPAVVAAYGPVVQSVYGRDTNPAAPDFSDGGKTAINDAAFGRPFGARDD